MTGKNTSLNLAHSARISQRQIHPSRHLLQTTSAARDGRPRACAALPAGGLHWVAERAGALNRAIRGFAVTSRLVLESSICLPLGAPPKRGLGNTPSPQSFEG